MNEQTNEAPVILNAPGEHTASVIWLHGLGADGHDFEPIVPALKLPARHGVKFIFPHAPKRAVTVNNGMVMRAWYDIREVNLRREEDQDGIRESADQVKKYIDGEIAAGIPADRILLAGFSQGGVIALQLGLRYEKTLAGIIALSTYLGIPDSLGAEGSEANRATPILMAHGIYDPIIAIAQAHKSREQLTTLGYQVEWHEFHMEHAVAMEEITLIGEWIQQQLAKSTEA